MVKVKRIEIKIRTRQTIEIARGDTVQLRWCAECGGQCWMIEPESAAMLADIETPTLYQWAHSGRVHSVEEGPERLLICLNSISIHTEKDYSD